MLQRWRVAVGITRRITFGGISLAFTERDKEIIIKIADSFYKKKEVISDEWLKQNNIKKKEYQALTSTIGVSLHGYALLPTPLRKKILDIATMKMIGRPMTEDDILKSFGVAGQASNIFPNCRINHCKCDSKNGEWIKDCMCMCHFEQAQTILGTTELDSDDFIKLAGSDKRA